MSYDFRKRANTDPSQYLEETVKSKKPYLKGTWVGPKTKHGIDIWDSKDPNIGVVRLTLWDNTSYKTDGRLRDPAKTKRIWVCNLETAQSVPIRVFSVTVIGEDESKMRVKREQVAKLMFKLFGIHAEVF